MRIARALVGVVVLGLAACQGAGEAATRASSVNDNRPNAASGMVNHGPEVVVSPQDAAQGVRADRRVVVRSYRGTLREVTLQAKGGESIEGELAEDRMSWRSQGPLDTATRYTVVATVVGNDGTETVSRSAFRTVKPQGTVYPNMTPLDGATVGVGMPIIVTFSTPVRQKARAAVEKAIRVESTPKVTGAWRWMSSQQVQWRPKSYWSAGTSVRIERDLRGIEVSPGYWGESARKVRFSVGSAMVSTVDVRSHTMTVRRNGTVLRRIPITTGKKGFETRNGTKVIMTKETKRRMDAETTGISKDDPEYYDVVVSYAMRLTGTGEFLHAAPWSVASQGRANVSHGCTGMSLANARWLFSNSKVGDVVEYVGSPRPLEWGNGYTAWEMSFAQWSGD